LYRHSVVGAPLGRITWTRGCCSCPRGEAGASRGAGISRRSKVATQIRHGKSSANLTSAFGEPSVHYPRRIPFPSYYRAVVNRGRFGHEFGPCARNVVRAPPVSRSGVSNCVAVGETVPHVFVIIFALFWGELGTC
jgi:hypothetical protein